MYRYINPQPVAILLATYNGATYLRQQLNSILHQKFSHFVCYIHDDNSSDNTKGIIKEFKSRYPNKIVEIQGPATGGSKNNFMFLLNCVESDYYAFSDQDDFWLPFKLELCFKKIKKIDNNKPSCIYTDLNVVDQNLDTIDNSFYSYTNIDPRKNKLKNLLMSNVCVGCTMMINRVLRDEAIEIESSNIMMHDWLAALIASSEGNLKFIPKSTMLYRQHASNVLGATRKASLFKRSLHMLNFRNFLLRKNSFVKRSRNMAKDITQLSMLTTENLKFLKAFYKVGEKNKFVRIKFYLKNSLYNQRSNKFWQLIWV